MSRKRKLNWGPVLWIAAVANVSAGLAYSPITSAAKVRVVGALPTDEARIRQAIQKVQGKPALRGGAEKAIEEVYRRPDVRSAEWSQNLFRRGLLVLRYDQPVARLSDPPNTVLTARGLFAQTREPVDQLPELVLFGGARDVSVSFGAKFEGLKLADICSRASSIGIERLSITVQENGAVCLNSGKTGRVALGSPDDLDTKFERLQEVLAGQPKILDQNQEIVLLAPGKPMVRPLGD